MLSASGLGRRWLPLALLSAVLLRLVLRAAQPLEDSDLWWHLRLGEEIRSGMSIREPEPLSSFATVAWVPTQWLPEVVASWVEDRAGLPGVAWLYGAAMVAVLLTLYVVCRRQADVPIALLATLAGIATTIPSLSPRPQVISFALLAVVVNAWLRCAREGRVPWLLVPLTWVWAMCHGFWFTGCLVGVGVVLGMALDRHQPWAVVGRAAAVPLLSLAVAALTPAGPRLLLAPFAVGERRQWIIEWQPPSPADGPVLVAGLMLVVIAVAFVRRRRSWVELALVAMSVIWLITAIRTVALAGIILAPLVAARLQAAARHPAAADRTERIWLAASALAGLVVLAALVPGRADQPGRVPVGLADRLDAYPPDTAVLNSYALGGWLEWRHPQLDPVVDGLADAYSVDHLRGYVGLLRLDDGWQDFLARSGARVALLDTADEQAVVDALREELGWRVVGDDGATLLLEAPRQ